MKIRVDILVIIALLLLWQGGTKGHIHWIYLLVVSFNHKLELVNTASNTYIRPGKLVEGGVD